MVFVARQDKCISTAWDVYDPSGTLIAVFFGEFAEKLAKEYADFKHGLEQR